MPSHRERPYHHPDLRTELVRAALQTIEEVGPAAMSVREVARRAGVTHAAATYHFGDKAGLLTEVARQGYRLLAEELERARRERRRFLELGVAYVAFAVRNRSYFEVMYRPELYNAADAGLLEARMATAVLLYGSADATDDQIATGVAAWSLVHGLATLWLNGNLPARLGDDPEAITRRVARFLRARRR